MQNLRPYCRTLTERQIKYSEGKLPCKKTHWPKPAYYVFEDRPQRFICPTCGDIIGIPEFSERLAAIDSAFFDEILPEYLASPERAKEALAEELEKELEHQWSVYLDVFMVTAKEIVVSTYPDVPVPWPRVKASIRGMVEAHGLSKLHKLDEMLTTPEATAIAIHEAFSKSSSPGYVKIRGITTFSQ